MVLVFCVDSFERGLRRRVGKAFGGAWRLLLRREFSRVRGSWRGRAKVGKKLGDGDGCVLDLVMMDWRERLDSGREVRQLS